MKKRAGAYAFSLILGWSFAIIVVVIASACSTFQKTTLTGDGKGPLYKYRPDMQITVGKETFDGMGATALAGPVDIKIASYAKLDLFKVSTCAREVPLEQVDDNRTTYHYAPIEKEKATTCPLYFEAVNKDGTTDWGYLAIRTDEKLPAHIDCNGEGWTFAGFTVCRTKAGLVQTMRFKVDVKEEHDGCDVTAIDKRTFEIRPHVGFCYLIFSDGKEYHRATILGYDQILVRGVKR